MDNKDKDKILSINYQSDWDFEYPLPSSYIDCPFKITLYTIDYEDNRYEAYYDGNNYVNCTISENHSIIVHIDNFKFYAGCIRVKVEWFVDSASFADGICNDVHAERSNIYITRASSDTNSVTYQGSPLPNFDPTNIANNVEKALNEIGKKNDEVNESLAALDVAQSRADELIDELTDWKAEADDLVHREELDEYAKSEDLGPYVTEDEVSDWLNHDYYTKDDSDDRYYTKAQVDQVLSGLNPDVDLTPYVTKNELILQSYITESYLNDKLSGLDLSGYVSYSYLESKHYLTTETAERDYATKDWIYGQNYLTLEYIDDNNIFHIDLDNYITKEQLMQCGYLTSHQDLGDYATKAYVLDKMNDIELSDYVSKNELNQAGYLTAHQSLAGLATEEYVDNAISNIDTHNIDLSEYVSKNELNQAGYLTTHQDLSSYATKTFVTNAIANAQLSGDGDIDLSGFVTKDELTNQSYLTNASLANYALKTEIPSITGLATEAYVNNAIQNAVPNIDLSGYVSKSELNDLGYLTSIPSEYITQAELSANGYLTSHQDLSDYATKSYVQNKTDDINLLDLFRQDTTGYFGVAEEGKGTYVSICDLKVVGDFQVEADEFTMSHGSIVADLIHPLSGNGKLGMADSQWAYTYTKNLILDGVDINNKLDNYISKTELGGLGYLTSIPSEYITQAELSANGYLTSHQSLAGLATENYVNNAINNIPKVDLSGYVSKSELNSLGYLTSIPSEYVTQAELSANGYLTSHQDLSNYATKAYVLDKVGSIDLTGYVSKEELYAAGYITYHQSLDGYATESYVMDKVNNIQQTVYENISIWQGTATQYASLANYTSYQLYLIAQS